MATSYFDLLKRPEWQRKRLEVMQRAGFKCQWCLATDKTLNVHHRFYRKGAKPWEYEDDVFVCMCEECHKKWHNALDAAKEDMGRLGYFELLLVLGYIRGELLMRLEYGDTHHPQPCKSIFESLGFQQAMNIRGLAVWKEVEATGIVTAEMLWRINHEQRKPKNT